MPAQGAVLATALHVLLVKPGGQTGEVKGVGAGQLDLASGRRDCIETDRALHSCVVSIGVLLIPMEIHFNFLQGKQGTETW